MLRTNFRHFFTLAAVGFVCGHSALVAQKINMIKGAVDESRRSTVLRSTHPNARAQFDQGAAPDSLPMDRMLLVLKRSPEQEAALDKFLDEVQQPSSPNYHQWLTPEEFGEQFGASDADVQAITTWLEGHGFQVEPVNAGRTVIEFSGNAGQVGRAFHTQMHRLQG